MMLVMMVMVVMIDRDVQESNGYFLKPSTLQVVDYVIERECELTQVKQMFKKRIMKTLTFS